MDHLSFLRSSQGFGGAPLKAALLILRQRMRDNVVISIIWMIFNVVKVMSLPRLCSIDHHVNINVDHLMAVAQNDALMRCDMTFSPIFWPVGVGPKRPIRFTGRHYAGPM
jgi:hypothetical protein